MDNFKNNDLEYNIRISLSNDWEIRWWTERLGISVPQLKEAVAKVGNSSAKIKAFLKD